MNKEQTDHSTVLIDKQDLDEPKKDISMTNTRFCLLFFACFITFGSYYAYDTPTALQTQLETVIKK
jgi:hypothetical protein